MLSSPDFHIDDPYQPVFSDAGTDTDDDDDSFQPSADSSRFDEPEPEPEQSESTNTITTPTVAPSALPTTPTTATTTPLVNGTKKRKRSRKPEESMAANAKNHPLRPPCNCNLKCVEVLGEERRREIHDEFWGLPRESQKAWAICHSGERKTKTSTEAYSGKKGT